MSAPATVEEHYSTGLTRANIERALIDAGKDFSALQPPDLAPLEDFHTMGRFATAALAELAGVRARDRVLDAGTGIGGAARFLTGQIGCHVTAVDLTAEYCEAAMWLNGCVGLADMIDVRRADVLELPFADRSFDVVFSQHVQMNIADKGALYREARRVLAGGGRLALWDVVAGPEQPIRLPVPWAVAPELSHLVSAEELRSITAGAGFEVQSWSDLTDSAVAAMGALLAAPPNPIGLQVFVPDLPVKAANLLENLRENRTRVVQALLVAS